MDSARGGGKTRGSLFRRSVQEARSVVRRRCSFLSQDSSGLVFETPHRTSKRSIGALPFDTTKREEIGQSRDDLLLSNHALLARGPKSYFIDMCRHYLCFIVFQLLLVFSLASSFASTTMATRQRTTTNEHQQRVSLLTMRGGSSTPSSSSSSNNSSQDVEAQQQPDAPKTELVLEISPTKRDKRLGPKASPPGFLRKTFPSLPWHKLPDWLTYVRCLAIPALVVSFYAPDRHVETSLLFAVASFTDWLDGYLARRWDITSAFGAFLDPVVRVSKCFTQFCFLIGLLL